MDVPEGTTAREQRRLPGVAEEVRGRGPVCTLTVDPQPTPGDGELFVGDTNGASGVEQLLEALLPGNEALAPKGPLHPRRCRHPGVDFDHELFGAADVISSSSTTADLILHRHRRHLAVERQAPVGKGFDAFESNWSGTQDPGSA